MTNPGNMVRVRARRGGRASVYEANAIAQAFNKGILAGTGVVQNTTANMNVLVGGTPTNPTVVLAATPTGYKIALDLVSQQSVALTKPAANSRISQIIAYTNDIAAATDESGTTGSPSTCGLIVVNGSASSSPSAPTDTEIRAAITADGGTGAQAAYAVLASVTVASTTAAISNSMISNVISTLIGAKIADSSIEGVKIKDGALTGAKLADKTVTNAKIADNTLNANKVAVDTGNSSVSPTNKNVIRLGGRKIMWGSGIVKNVKTDTDAVVKVNFPEAFANVPRVIVSINGWYGIAFVQVANEDSGDRATTTTSFAAVVRHGFGSNLNINFNYVAIG